jgi:uncharacterized protein
MAPITHTFDLASLHLEAGQARRLDVEIPMAPLMFAGERYVVAPSPVPARLDVSRTTGAGWSLRLRFAVRVVGPCMRCLEPAEPELVVDIREIDQPSGGEELSSPYLDKQALDTAAFARDALALALPTQIVCRPECAGLCAVCGANLNDAGPGHEHDSEPDPRWAKLRELRLE